MPVYRTKTPHECTRCGATYFPCKYTKSPRYCSKQCTYAAMKTLEPKPCEWCKKLFTPTTSRIRFCCRSCIHLAYRKPVIRPNGYRIITVDGVEIKEHRHVMEQHLGRKLSPEEHVHHKDGNRINNDVSNLEVLSRSEHRFRHCGYRDDKQKECLTCKIIKPHEEFTANRGRKDGRGSHCRACQLAKRAEGKLSTKTSDT